MKEPKRILFVSQQIYPFLAEETPLRMLNRKLPQACQEAGYETRTFMPKFGEINERKNQLHEVIRLSGINIIIAEADHPLLLKVASIQSARIQVYFIDNDDYFNRRKGVVDQNGAEYPDNEERCIFFARGTLETIQKLRWLPDIVQCSGWMSALVPFYLRTAFKDTPFFARTKVVVGLTDERFSKPFSPSFATKTRFEGVNRDAIAPLFDKEVSYQTLMKLSIKYADAVTIQTPGVDPELIAYAHELGKEVLDYKGDTSAYVETYRQMLAEMEVRMREEAEKQAELAKNSVVETPPMPKRAVVEANKRVASRRRTVVEVQPTTKRRRTTVIEQPSTRRRKAAAEEPKPTRRRGRADAKQPLSKRAKSATAKKATSKRMTPTKTNRTRKKGNNE